jgi:hypothetical protein
MPATMNDAMNCGIPTPMLATMTALLASSPTFGCMLSTRPGKSECALDQTPLIFLPTIGHSSIPAGGAGITKVLCCTAPTKS